MNPIYTQTHIPTHFGHRLRLARIRAQLSQAGLAQRLGVGQDTISHYEKGQSQPNIVMTYYLAEILAVDVNYFFPIQANDADDDTLALLQSLSIVSYSYILQFIEQAARGQQQQHFFHKELSRDRQQCIQQGIERELQALEGLQLRNQREELFAGLAHFSLILTYLAQLDRELVAEDTLQRIWQQNKRFLQFVRDWQEASCA